MALFELENLRIHSLKAHSEVLKGNPLGDSHIRHHLVLEPAATRAQPRAAFEEDPLDGLPLVVVLSGYSSNGTKSFSWRSFEANDPQRLDQLVGQGKAPRAIYVFVDAWTFWGGSQFINSPAVGRYEDHIVTELIPSLYKSFPNLSRDSRRCCVYGGSSGGYGALHLASRYPEIFGMVAAQAPDSFFEVSLLPELYSAWPHWLALGGLEGIRRELEEGRLLKKRFAHSLLNAVAMGLCYAPTEDGRSFEWPFNPETGALSSEVWQRWKAHDPCEFLPQRREQVKKWQAAYLDVGTRDQFHLYFGARQIRNELLGQAVDLDYSEFAGDHFELGDRRPHLWQWLADRQKGL